MLSLSNQAINDLRRILAKETGGAISDLSQDELNEIGELLLAVLAESLKMRSNSC